MKARVIVLMLGLAVGGCMHGKHEEENEVKLSFDKVPAAVQAGLQREAGGGTINTVDREMEKGKTIYEADVMINGKNWEIKVAENGDLISKKIDEEDEKGEHGDKD